VANFDQTHPKLTTVIADSFAVGTPLMRYLASI
jgi:hypothetical protein